MRSLNREEKSNEEISIVFCNEQNHAKWDKNFETFESEEHEREKKRIQKFSTWTFFSVLLFQLKQ